MVTHPARFADPGMTLQKKTTCKNVAESMGNTDSTRRVPVSSEPSDSSRATEVRGRNKARVHGIPRVGSIFRHLNTGAAVPGLGCTCLCWNCSVSGLCMSYKKKVRPYEYIYCSAYDYVF